MQNIFLNKIIVPSLSLVFILMVCAFQSGDKPCDQRTLKEKTKKLLDPYKYDNAKTTNIVFTKDTTKKEIEVPLFIGEKYRLVFNTEGLPKNVVINLFNRDKDSKKRKLLFSSKGDADKKQFSFDYSFANKIFIQYDIPPMDSLLKSQSGCMIYMLGYK